MINSIELRSTNDGSYTNKYGAALRFLPNIKHINIFVGENNSGKSRLMRALVKSKDAVLLSDSIKSNYEKEITTNKESLLKTVNKIQGIYSAVLPHPIHEKMTPTALYAYYSDYFEHIKLAEMKFDYPNQNLRQDAQRSINRIYQIIATQSNRESTSISSVNRVYIPVLRGVENYNEYFNTDKNATIDNISMTSAQRDAIDEYKNNANKIYNNKVSSVYKMPSDCVFTGENLYEVIRDKLLGKESDRIFIRDFEIFISHNFYDDEGFTLIPRIDEGYLSVKIGDKEERPLHDFGDGIKQLICVLYKIFEQRDSEALFFLEEPEINLHPGYQRKFIEILRQKQFDKLYFFIATHSNHFVDKCFDEADDISIFKFININKENNRFEVTNTSIDDIDLLNALGVNNSSVFMANATIWVEGLSDKLYLDRYMRVYIKGNGLQEFKEGVDYSFVEYSGNNIAHWEFEDDENKEGIRASGITNRTFIIVDNDNDSSKKTGRKEWLRQVFGDNYFELPVREIENTIKQSVLETTLFGGVAPVFKTGMKKAKDRFNTKSAYVWQYIDSHYELKKKYWNATTKQPRVNKVKFARDICENINSIDDLTPQAVQTCEAIYNFLMRTYKDINE